MPLVSICLPNLNMRPFLDARMASIMAQTLGDWELIVCDSHSEDGAWEFFQQFRHDRRVQLHQVPREGVYAGWNECLRRARGEYVYVATSDDTAEPRLLERMVGLLERHRDVDLAVCRFEFIDQAGAPMRPVPLREVGTFYDPWRDVPHRRSGLLEFVVHVGLDCPSWTTITSVVFRRRLIEKVGFFRTDCGTSADRLWAMRAALVTDTLSVPEVLATWRWHAAQASWGGRSPRDALRNWAISVETVRDCLDRLPARWRVEPRCIDLLTRNVRGEYLKRIGLDRMTLRRHPAAFLRGVRYALGHERRYLLKRLASGLSWRQDDFGGEEAYVKALIDRWQIPWPPAAVQDA